MATRCFSPHQLNPLGHNPLPQLLTELLYCALLSDQGVPRLIIAATDVATGQAVLFDNAAIAVEVLLASWCLPFVFPAVKINGRAWWDGGFAGNPPLSSLLSPRPPAELDLIRAQPARRPGTPSTPMEIMDRLNEIGCHNVLTAELASLPPTVRVGTYDADEALLDLPISSKFNGAPEFLFELFQAGRAAVATPTGGPGGRRLGSIAPTEKPDV